MAGVKYVPYMELNRTLEQHIAVFGESGSGKTVMLSSFYGAAQEPQFLKSSRFDVTADDTGQGHRLHRNYLGMRDSATRPETTRFSSTAYAFSVKLRDKSVKEHYGKQFDALRLVWHDYPGEWFEQDVSGPEEARRRIDAFKALLGSDVALLLVDGQRLLDNAGEEERYLKSLLGSFRTGLLRLKDDLLEDGKPLVKFPRIWILALSKADLLPEIDVFKFRDLVVSKASEDLDELRKVLKGFVESPDAFAVGEDFVLLSSAKFEANRIEVTERIGIELILPMAAMLPFERHTQWVKEKRAGAKLTEDLIGDAAVLAAALMGKAKLPGPIGFVVALVARNVVNPAAELVGDRLKERNAEALAKQEYMSALLTRFRLDLDDGEKEQVLLRSRR